MQHNYPVIRKIEIELKQLDQSSVPARPRKYDFLLILLSLAIFVTGVCLKRECLESFAHSYALCVTKETFCLFYILRLT